MQQSVPFLDGGRALDVEHAVRQRGTGQRHADSVAVEPPLQFGEDLRDRSGRAGRGWDQAAAARARPAQVFVRGVDDRLGISEAEDCGQAAVADAEALMDHRSEEHTSELPSLMSISYDGFCLKKKKQYSQPTDILP